MNHILITGANGQLGRCLQDKAQLPEWNMHQYFYTDVDTLDICDKAQIERFVSEHSIDVIINAAAYTAVDKAEDEVDMAYKLNRDAVRNLAEVARKHDCLLMHISTDYVFSGEACHPYTEDDTPAPKSVYGASKLAGEQAIAEVGCRAIIIRTSWLYSEYGRNFVKTMLQLGRERDEVSVVCDQIGGPTYAGDLAQAVMQCVAADAEHEGVHFYHFANEGVISWYDFAKAIMEISGSRCTVRPIFTGEYPAKASRPAYSVFNLRKVKEKFGITIPYWRESLILTINKLSDK